MTNGEYAIWADKIAIAELLIGYFRLIDDKDFALEKMQAIFADDGVIVRPNGSVSSGLEEIASSHTQSFARFRATQHLPSNYAIELDKDTATVRANLVAMHMWADGYGDTHALDRHFTAGNVVRASVRRTANGWRLTCLENQNVWRSGSGIGMMEQTNKS